MDGITIGLMIGLFILTIFGLVSSVMLFNEYRGQNKKETTEYKYSIGSMVIFILALVGVLVGMTFAFSSGGGPQAKAMTNSSAYSAPKSNTQTSVNANRMKVLEKVANTIKETA